MKLKLAIGDVVRELELKHQGETLTLTDERGDTHTVRLLRRDGRYLELLIDETSVHVLGTSSGDRRHMWANGRLWRYEHLKEGVSQSGSDPGSLCVSIPAVVTEILVKVGDAVTTGDKLILLESMKIVLSIQAPQDGVIKAVLCAVDQAVDPDVPLIELEPA